MGTLYFTGVVTEENGSFGIHFPDLPGCVSAGDTLEEALDGAHEALALHIEGMQEDKEEIPTPSRPDVIRKGIEGEYYTLAPIPVKTEVGELKRINIMLNENLIKRVDEQAKSEGLTRSVFLSIAAKNQLRNKA